MGRKKNEIEARRELTEGDLALLGTARVYLSLIYERIDATSILDIHNVMVPALDDIKRADELIKIVQANISQREQSDA